VWFSTNFILAQLLRPRYSSSPIRTGGQSESANDGNEEVVPENFVG